MRETQKETPASCYTLFEIGHQKEKEKGSPLRMTSAAHRHRWYFACMGEGMCFAETAVSRHGGVLLRYGIDGGFVIDGMEYLD